jgi:predicted CoA-binding protein
VSFANPPFEAIAAMLRSARTIAVLGLSANPARPSHRVARALQRHGYRIIPVNPTLASWEGSKAVGTLDAAYAALAPGERIDIVDVFRRPEYVPTIVDDCIRLQVPTLWLQLGVVDERAALRAQQAGIRVVMDRCIYVDRAALE